MWRVKFLSSHKEVARKIIPWRREEKKMNNVVLLCFSTFLYKMDVTVCVNVTNISIDLELLQMISN